MDFRAVMVRGGAGPAAAQDYADMVQAQNDGIYDAEPHRTVAATGFRRWCQDTLAPAARP